MVAVTLWSLTPTTLGDSPGALAVERTVRAETWLTDLTVAAQIQGPPKKAQAMFIRESRTISRWSPAPFSSLVFSIMMSSQIWVSMKSRRYKRMAGRIAAPIAQTARGLSSVPIGEINHPLTAELVT